MRIEDHLLALAQVGPDEHHPAVAKPDMGDLHGDRDARDQHDLVAPVELVGLARRIVERHIGLGRHRPACLRPGSGISADGIVAACVSQGPKLLVDPDQRQTLAGRLVRVAEQKLVELLLPRADPRHRLVLALIAELRLVRAQDLAHRVARHMQFPHDLLQRPALHVEGPTDPRNRIHPLQLPLRPLTRNGRSDRSTGGSKLHADHPA